MSDTSKAAPTVTITPLTSSKPAPPTLDAAAVVCERCGGANVYRMHAVWRCVDCGFKTDCCGW